MRHPLLAVFSALVFATAADAGGGPVATDPALSIDPVVSGLAQPTAMAFVGTDDFLILEQATGQVRRVTGGVLNGADVLDLAVEGRDERGLLGIALHPDFATNDFVYLFYNPSNEIFDTTTGAAFNGYNNVVDRFEWDPSGNGGAGSLTFDMNILTVHSDVPYHNGGSISFGPDGKLYGVIGDGGHNDEMTNGKLQNNATGDPDDTGIVFRVNDDGSAPTDNPFGETGMEKVFAYGIRNSFGITWDPVSGALWETENGEEDYDEVNRIDEGMNGGWAKIMGPDSRDSEDESDLFAFAGSAYSDPEFSWNDTVAPTGIAFGGSALGDYENDLFVGDFNNGFLYRFELNGARTALALSGNLSDLVADNDNERDSVVAAEGFGNGPFSGISDLETGPDGGLYVVSIGNGTVHKVTSKGAGPATHDISFTSLKPPKKVAFTPGPPAGKPLKLSLQNVGTATETIQNQDALDDLIDVTFTQLPNMSCAAPAVTKTLAKGTFPYTWEPNKKLSVGLGLTWNNCMNDPLATTKTENHDDFTLEATLDLDALGQTDADAGNDTCPRAGAGDDKGCGKTDVPFRIDLYLK